MMVSEFVALVSRLLNLSDKALILLMITSLLAGAAVYRIVKVFRNLYTLLLWNLVLLMFWLSSLEYADTPIGVWLTACLALSGFRLYKHLVAC